MATNGNKKSSSFSERHHKRHRPNHGYQDSVEVGPKYPIVNADSFVLERGTWDPVSNPEGTVPVVVCPLLDNENSKKLKDAQREGIKFMWDCFKEKKGGILAHEMGLGKTRSTITLIATLLEQSPCSSGRSKPGIKKVIVIAPKVAITGWEDEFIKWCPRDAVSCKVQILRPGNRNAWDVVDDFKKNSSNVLVLTYESFQTLNGGGRGVRWQGSGFTDYGPGSIDIVICDEAHRLKNPNTQVVKNMKNFKRCCKLWIGLTGTPFQNNIEEFCCLVSFFRPEILENNLRTDYCIPIMQSMRAGGLNDNAKQLLGDLRDILRPALHFKINELNIEKHEITMCIPLHGHPKYYTEEAEAEECKMQHKLYEMLVQTLKESQIYFFERLSYLDKACVHPKYLIEGIKRSKNMGCFAKELEYYKTVFTPEEFQDGDFDLHIIPYSAKIGVAIDMIRRLIESNKKKVEEKNGEENSIEKIIVVSFSTTVLDYLRNYLENYVNINTVGYSGVMSDGDKKRSLEKFESEDSVPVLLLSLKAGGVALNLTRANHLILMDPDYNPATDRQALARILRQTQERPVYLYRLLSTGTLEEQKYLLQLGKEEMKKYFQENSPVNNILSPYDEKHLLEYYQDAESYILRKLEELAERSVEAEFENAAQSDQASDQLLTNDDLEAEFVDGAFAEELMTSIQYSKHRPPPPKDLPLVHHVRDRMSYAFHVIKKPDLAQVELLTPLTTN